MLLGQILIKEGFCTEKDILFALDIQRNGDKRYIGEILIEEGRITEKQLKTALEIQFGKYPEKTSGQKLLRTIKKVKETLFK